jgi:hypothetical protein
MNVDKLVEDYDIALLRLGTDDSFDEAALGFVYSDGVYKLVYDTDVVIKILILQGMTNEEAREWFDYNISCSYVGEQTPLFLQKGII